MAILTNTVQTSGIVGAREDLEDVIADLFPDESYAQTTFDKVDATAVYHEWLLDILRAPASNINVDGDDLGTSGYASYTQPTRAGNYSQILRATFAISGTADAVSKAGRKRETARQLVKQMRELKNDFEYALVRNQGASAGGSATGRSLASMESWLATNAVKTTSTASAATTGFTVGGAPAPSDGTTTVAIAESHLKSAIQGAWSAGGNPTTILTSATQKANLDAFTGVAQRFVDVGRTEQASVIGASNMYVSSFGSHKIVVHRHVRTSVVLVIDPTMWAIAYLRRPYMQQMAITGDADKRMLLLEGTLVCRNEKASAKVVACA